MSDPAHRGDHREVLPKALLRKQKCSSAGHHRALRQGPAAVKMVRVAGDCYNWNNSYDSYVSKNIMK